MTNLYEDSEYLDQIEEKPQDPLFYEASHQPGRFNRYERGYSSGPQPEIEPKYQAWQLAPLGGSTHDEPGYFSDDELRRMVETTIKADPSLSNEEKGAIKIEVSHKQTSLSGRVQSPEAKTQAETDAYWTEGIGEVKNEIEVRKKE